MALLNFLKKDEEKNKKAEDKRKTEEKTENRPAVEIRKDRETKEVRTAVVKEKKEFLGAKSASEIILQPRVTEKATSVQQNNVYVFEVYPNATKAGVADAVRGIYKVDPVKVNIVKTPAKKVFIRGKKGVKAGVKKAYVYLKEGERIDVL